MSFTTDVIEELLNAPEGKTCCRKAMLYGLFMSARKYGDHNLVEAEFKVGAAAQRAADILQKHFAAKAEINKTVRVGREVYTVSVQSKALNNFLLSIDTLDESEMLENAAELLVGFRCSACATAFLRGVVISCATVNEPSKGYHMELMLPSQRRARLISDLLTNTLVKSRVCSHNGRFGMIFKNNSAIVDILCYLGATQSGFYIANMYIKKNIINREKRATNCDTGNISRSVEATHKHLEAIEYLQECGAILKLDATLQYTAQLRMENPSATLKELAAMHNPPITKSGLNGRFLKIVKLYQEEKTKK